MKKFALQILSLLLLCVMQACTSDEPSDPDSGQEISPDENVPDPAGTIALSMRDYDNGHTLLDNCIDIRYENFRGGYLSSLGEVSGLGNISYIPKTGWVDRMAVIPGNGYVAYANNQYYRIYVVDYATSTLGGIIGADVKYQTPFKGVNEEIKIDVSNLTFSNDGGEQGVVFENENIVVFTATSSAEWCKVERCTTHDTSFLYNGVVITVDPNEENMEDEEATVTLTTAYGKKKEIKITRAAADANIRIVNSNSLPTELSPKQDSISIELAGNMPLYMLSTESDQEWCEVKLVNNSSRMASRAAEIKSIEGRPVSRSSVGSDAYSFVWQVSATANNSEEKREATIFLKDKSGATILTHSITQEEGYFFASAATSFPLKGHAAQDIHAIDFFSHRADYTVTSSESWCKGSIEVYGVDNRQLDGKSYNDAYVMGVILDLEENTEETPRKAILTISTPDNGISREITIEQTGAFISFLNDVIAIKYSKDEGTYSTWVYSSSEDIVVTSSEEWCEVTATTYGLNPDLGIATGVQIKVAANETSDDRTAIITAATSDGKIKKELKVIQSDHINVIVEKTAFWFDRKTNSQTIVVSTDAATYTPISSDESWLTFSTNGNELTIRATPTTKERYGKITFEGSDTKIEVFQSKYAVGDKCHDYGTTGTVVCMQDSIRFIATYVGGKTWSLENVETGAISAIDGEYNMSAIKQIANWQSFYPAFAAVEALNVNGVTGWYLPAANEARRIAQYYKTYSSYDFCSSSENSKQHYVVARSNGVMYIRAKSEQSVVYAVHKF